LFDFVETQLQDQKFEEQINQALCEPEDELTMRRQVQGCFEGLNSQNFDTLTLEGNILAIYCMLHSQKQISYAIETTDNWYAFFWEAETGTYCTEWS
jgi:hypothetical protein